MYSLGEGRAKMKMIFEENIDDVFGVIWRWEKWKRGRISDTGIRYR